MRTPKPAEAMSPMSAVIALTIGLSRERATTSRLAKWSWPGHAGACVMDLRIKSLSFCSLSPCRVTLTRRGAWKRIGFFLELWSGPRAADPSACCVYDYLQALRLNNDFQLNR